MPHLLELAPEDEERQQLKLWCSCHPQLRRPAVITAKTHARPAKRSELRVEISYTVLLIAATATETPLGCFCSTRHDGELLREHHTLIC